MTRAVAKDVQDSDDEQEPIKVSFSLPQIAGGALAAATAAAIGSQLGVAGTIVGAAVASVVGGVAGTLYSAGLDRTHRRVSDAIVRGYDRVRHDPDYDPDVPLVLAADGGQPDTADATAATAGAARPEDPTRVDLARATVVGPPERDRFRVWKVMLLTVGAIFLVGLAVITVLELGLGRALGGGDGTTVSQVVQPSKSSAKPSATPSPTTTSPTPTPTATTTVTVTPSASPSPTASGTATASAPPTGVVEPSPTTPRTPAPTGAAESSGKP